VSKPSRRRQQPGSQPSTARPAGAPPPSGSPTSSGGSPSSGAGAAAGAKPAGTTGAPGSTPRSSAPTSRPTGSASRHGRRERQRLAYQPSFMERNRTPIIVVAGIVGVALIAAFVFFSASQPAYACSTVWSPAPTASPSAGATPALGYVQPLMGNSHVGVGEKVTYTYCAPASGNHLNRPGTAGPIPARVYGPSDNVIPQGWLHNLEHGGLVVLYQGSSAGATPDGQAQLREFHAAFPPVTGCGPVIARFDQMSSPFQAILWGRVLPMQTWDPTLVTAFWKQWGGLTNPELACPVPNSRTSPSPGASPVASAAPSPSAAPSVAAPSASPAPSAAASPS